jgi:predicted nucleotidyltransferase
LSSVKVFWADRAALDVHLRRYVSSLRDREEVLDVYLCGSWAKGTYTAASDVDLLILIKDDSAGACLTPRDRMPAYLPDSFPTGLDLFVYTAREARESAFARSMLDGALILSHGSGL